MRHAFVSFRHQHGVVPIVCQSSILSRSTYSAKKPSLNNTQISSVASISSSHLLRRSLGTITTTNSRRARDRRSNTVQPLAMVNVDVSPSVILGVGLIGAGVSLWQIRQSKPWISKDYDVVVSCISLLVGGILIFQGWRLDPLLLFGQLMTTGAAVSFGVEALRLRSEVYEQEEKSALQDVFKRKGPKGGGGNGSFQQLPPPPFEGANQGWAGSRWQQDDGQQTSYYSNEQQQYQQPVGMYNDGSSGASTSSQYVEADYYDPYAEGQVQRYGDEEYAPEEDQYYREDGTTPTQFEFPSEQDGGEDPSRNSSIYDGGPKQGRGGLGFGTGEDWE
jgi:Ycf66 protein N-terminus